MVIQQLGIKTGDTLILKKVKAQETVIQGALLTPDRTALSPMAIEMFTDWFQMYKTADDVMDAVSLGKFVTNATRQNCPADDNRVKALIDAYAKSENSKNNRCLTLDEFLFFYKESVSAIDVAK